MGSVTQLCPQTPFASLFLLVGSIFSLENRNRNYLSLLCSRMVSKWQCFGDDGSCCGQTKWFTRVGEVENWTMDVIIQRSTTSAETTSQICPLGNLNLRFSRTPQNCIFELVWTLRLSSLTFSFCKVSSIKLVPPLPQKEEVFPSLNPSGKSSELVCGTYHCNLAL